MGKEQREAMAAAAREKKAAAARERKGTAVAASSAPGSATGGMTAATGTVSGPATGGAAAAAGLVPRFGPSAAGGVASSTNGRPGFTCGFPFPELSISDGAACWDAAHGKPDVSFSCASSRFRSCIMVTIQSFHSCNGHTASGASSEEGMIFSSCKFSG
uniref:Uncharacterized protein n=1 Tax=Arundo donax TaxID=35708 RepID=A0A0A9EQ36_ARUDO